jgi:hypothetical protein
MSEASAMTVLERGGNRLPAHGRARPSRSSCLDFDGVGVVEIVAPDGYCAALLLEHVAPLCPGEIVFGPGWIVRFQPPTTGGDWVPELLSSVERWLASVPLPCAKVIHGDRDYLLRASNRPAGVEVQ